MCVAIPCGAAPSLPADFINETLVTGLDQPTSMALLPDGRVLITEQRTGKIRLIVNGQVAAKDPIFTVPDLNASGFERGLQFIAVDPGWPTSPYVYISHNRTGGKIRLVRYAVEGETAQSDGDSLTFNQPLILLDDIPDDDENHNAGCLRFGPEGHLFISLGEDEDVCAAADSTSLKGQILRLDVSSLPLSGGPVPRGLIIPEGNPFYSHPDSNAGLVWAYGFRNPWRFHIDPQFEAIYSADVGEADFEEISEVLPGDFLGWPWREANLVMPRPACPEPGGEGANNYKAPIVALARGPQLTAILSAGMYRRAAGIGTGWPAEYGTLFGDVFYAEYFGGWIRRVKKQGGVWQDAPAAAGQPNATDWASGLDRPVDFWFDDENNLYWLSQFDQSGVGVTGSLNRIRYVPPAGVPVRPGVPRIMASAPNPFAARTELSFTLPEAEAVTLLVYDVGGRLIRRLVDGRMPAGTTRVTWDGRSDSGGIVPPGVYLAHLERERSSETLRLLRLK